jgi:hypothetical protein
VDSCGLVVLLAGENAAASGRWKPEQKTVADAVDSELARRGMSVLRLSVFHVFVQGWMQAVVLLLA